MSKKLLLINIFFFILGSIWNYNVYASYSEYPLHLRLVWQTTNADLDLKLINPNGEECYWYNSQTEWGAILDYDSRGGRQDSDTFPYQEQISLNIDGLLSHPGTYRIEVSYYEWDDNNNPQNVSGSVDIYMYNKFIGTYRFTISPGETVNIWQGEVGETNQSSCPSCPSYPVLLVHGFTSNGNTWKTYISDWTQNKNMIYGGRITIDDKFHIFQPGGDANSNSFASLDFDMDNLFDINIKCPPNHQCGENFDMDNLFDMNFSNNNDISFFAQGIELQQAVKKILEVTGAEGVYVVAHSMGGLAARVYLQFFNDHKIRGLITIGTPNGGVPLENILPLSLGGDVQDQFKVESDDLNISSFGLGLTS